MSKFSAEKAPRFHAPAVEWSSVGIARLSLGAAILCGLCFAYFVYGTRIVRPYADQLDLIALFFDFEQRGGLVRYLFEPHTVHRIPWYRMLLALDVAAFKGTTIPFLAAAAACMLALTVMLWREVAVASSGPLRLAAQAFSVMMLLGTASAANVSVPANTPAVHMLFFGVLALVLAERRVDSTGGSTGARRVGAVLACAAAAFSNAVGLVLWPVLAFMAWRAGRSERTWLCWLVLSGAAFGVAYLAGQSSDPGPTTLSVQDFVKAGDYLLAYMGMPWARAFGGVGRFIGLLLLMSSVVAVLTRGGARAGRAERMAVSLILLSLGTAVLAAWARADLTELVDVPARYRIYMAPLHIGLLMLALPWLERQWAVRRRAVEAAVMGCFCLVMVQQVLIGQVAAKAAERARQTITDFHLGVRTPDMRWVMSEDIPHVEVICAELQRRGLYFHGHGVPRGW